MTSVLRYVGIDVAQATLELADRPDGRHRQFTNDAEGLTALVALLTERRPTLTVLEATGALQVPVVAALAVAGLPVALVTPRQVRDFTRAGNRLAKTDRVDAAVLAHCGEVFHPEPQPLPDSATQELRELLARRRDLVADRVAEKQRLSHRYTDPAKASIQWS